MSVSFIKLQLSKMVVKSEFYVVLLSLLIAAVTKEVNITFFWAAIVYGMIILNRRTELKNKKLMYDSFDPQTPQFIDTIVNECFQEYLIFNKAFEKDKEYISAEDEKMIIEEMIRMVSTRMSKTLMMKIRGYYNEELAEDVIAQKIYMIVMNYSINNNAMQTTEITKLDSDRKKDGKMVRIL